jgi:MFS transporter, BCD family, chlorophyll transporter
MWRKQTQLTLIHTAVAMTLVPITSTLNRVMITELNISATLVSVLVAIPYLLSPIQIAIGSYSDKHPVLGRRRLPYTLLGLILCVGGAMLSPIAAYSMAGNSVNGIVLGLLAFGSWGMGFNFATVSYLSLASELWDEKGRSRTIAVMFTGMIAGIILTSLLIGEIVEPYSPQAIYRAFAIVCAAASLMGVLGLIGLEPRAPARSKVSSEERYSIWAMVIAITANPQARLFFIYLFFLLAAILGQDILLEPYAGEAFALPVSATTRITSIWGTCVLGTMALSSFLQGRWSKVRIAGWGGAGAALGFVLIAASGPFLGKSVFYAGVVLLGLGTGLSTVSNLSLMLDMTAPEKVGLFMGAWGMANAFSRLTGSIVSGVLRDGIEALSGNAVTGFSVVFAILALMLVVSLVLLRFVDVRAFKRGADSRTPLETAALLGDASS